ncbi:MAG TPA: N-acetylneuraminate synthase family protein [Vitreimonas sp.]|nr:N-acetylneuraminate synthase family protein [Vitreimonas sp.]
MTAGRVLFVIPARGGSRRIPGKNLRTVAGIPLVGWAVRTARLAARSLGGPEHVVVCSTDDAGISAVARAWGADIVDRPPALASDEAPSVDVALHALDALEGGRGPFRAVVLVQPTSPLSDPSDVRSAVERFDRGPAESVVSVAPSHPAAFHVVRDPGAGIRPVEAAAAGHLLTGAFYVVSPAALRRERAFVIPDRTLGFAVPPERSVDVDEPADLAVAEALAASRPIAPLRVAGRDLGGDDRVFVIAEGGVNHDGRVDLAHQLIDAAADAGADAVKFQTFDPDALVSAAAPTADYQREAGETGGQREMLRRLALPDDAWPGLQAHAADRGLVFLSTPFDDASADLLDRLEVPAFKVGSGELTNLPFLERLADRGRPILLSTGMADMVEVAAAVDAIHGTGNPQLALLHCVSAYPARVEDANLRALVTMRSAFGLPTGWSDHTPGIDLPVAATALGAAIIEKHLTLDMTMPGPDHRTSLEPSTFAEMVRSIRSVGRALGGGEKRPVDAEVATAAVARRSLHWGRSLRAGDEVGEQDLVAVRPGTGVPPGRVRELVGRRAARPVTAGTIVDLEDLEDPA